MNSNLVYWLWVANLYGVASPSKWNFISNYDSIEAAYNAVSSGDFRHVPTVNRALFKNISLDYAEKILAYLEKHDIKACGFDSDEYPQRLKDIYNPPAVLFYRGDISLIDKSVVIACVGTRNPSDYSVRVCSKICADLAKAGIVIASGFQVGLDTLANDSAMQVGGKTIAVLPSGIMYDYPKETAKAKAAVAENGLVITELFPEDKPNRGLFHARNRILSGVSLGTLVLQAGSKSGALSTANYALSQGKDIFCISPHDLTDEAYSGVINLIRDGAISVFDARDVINEYYSNHSRKLNMGEIFALKTDSPLFSTEKKSPKPKAPKAPKSDAKPEPKPKSVRQKPKPAPTDLSDDRQAVYDFIVSRGNEAHFDELTGQLADKLDDVEATLTDMEVDGIILSLPGNRFSII